MREVKPSIHRNTQTDNICDAEISANRDNLPPDITYSACDILSASICNVSILSGGIGSTERRDIAYDMYVL